MSRSDVMTQSTYQGGMSSSAFTRKVLPIFSLGLFMTGVASLIGWNLPIFFLIFAVIGELVMLFTSRLWAYNEKANANIGMFLLFTTLSGITLVPILKWGLNIGGVGLLAQALGVSAATFGGLALFGATTKRDFSGLGGFLFAAILGLILSSIATMLIGGGSLAYLLISFISVIVFSGFVLYDMAMIRRVYSDNDYIPAAIALYLDFINLFQDILRIFGILGSKDD